MTAWLATAAGCSAALDYPTPGPSAELSVRLLHAAPDLGPVQLLLTGEPFGGPRGYREAPRYHRKRIPLTSESVPFDLAVVGAEAGEVVAEVSPLDALLLEVREDGDGSEAFTVYLFRNADGVPSVRAVRDDPTPSGDPGYVRIRLAVLVPEVAPVWAFRPPNLALIGGPVGFVGPYGTFPIEDGERWGFDLHSEDPRRPDVVAEIDPWSTGDVVDSVITPFGPSGDGRPGLCLLGVDESFPCYDLVPGEL